MMENQKQKWYTNKKTLTILIAVLVISIVGMAFAYYFAILKGNNVNTATTSGASLVYTEPEMGIETAELSDYQGMTSETSYDFSISGQSKGNETIDYIIYAEEEEGNTVDASQIKVYLTDENDIPEEEYVTYVEPALFTPEGIKVDYTEGYDYKIDYNYNEVTGNMEGRTEHLEEALYIAYAEHVLGLVEGDVFYTEFAKYDEDTGEEISVCLEHTLNYEHSMYEAANSGDLTEVDMSQCNAKFSSVPNEETGEELIALVDNTGNVIAQVTSQEYNVKVIEDGEEIIHDSLDSYLTDVTGSESYPLKKVYIFETIEDYELQGLPNDLPSYCVQNGTVVDDSNCENSYQQVVGQAVPKTFNSTTDEEAALSNVLLSSNLNFEGGEISYVGKTGDVYLDKKRMFDNPRLYKLRYWISTEEQIGKGEEIEETTTEEVTPTTDGNTHTVEFGGNETFKFKVNVYAKQGK